MIVRLFFPSKLNLLNAGEHALIDEDSYSTDLSVSGEESNEILLLFVQFAYFHITSDQTKVLFFRATFE